MRVQGKYIWLQVMDKLILGTFVYLVKTKPLVVRPTIIPRSHYVVNFYYISKDKNNVVVHVSFGNVPVLQYVVQ